MKTKVLDTQKSGAGLLIFLAWLMYTTSYLGKVNYSANITQIIDFYDITKPVAGIVPTFLFFSYGIGQVVNGILCRRYNRKWVVAIAICTSAVINLIIGFTTSFAIVKWLWLINGFVLSMLWPTLIRLLSESLPQKDLAKSSIVMGTTVASGTIIVYLSSSVFAAFGKFKLSFFLAAFAGIVSTVIWLLFYKRAVRLADTARQNEKAESNEKTQTVIKSTGADKKFYMSVAAICFCAVGINLIKDGLGTWVPSILKDSYGMSDSISILLTLLLPIVAIFANAFALGCHKKIPDYVTHNFLIFMVSAVFIGAIIFGMSVGSAMLVIICLVIVNFFISSLNSLTTSIFPIFMRSKVNSGLFAGVLNGFCYLGSTISSYGLGFIAESFGWISVFWVLIGFCALVAVVYAVYRLLSGNIRKACSP